jgi:hypothetical protein
MARSAKDELSGRGSYRAWQYSQYSPRSTAGTRSRDTPPTDRGGKPAIPSISSIPCSSLHVPARRKGRPQRSHVTEDRIVDVPHYTPCQCPARASGAAVGSKRLAVGVGLLEFFLSCGWHASGIPHPVSFDDPASRQHAPALFAAWLANKAVGTIGPTTPSENWWKRTPEPDPNGMDLAHKTRTRRVGPGIRPRAYLQCKTSASAKYMPPLQAEMSGGEPVASGGEGERGTRGGWEQQWRLRCRSCRGGQRAVPSCRLRPIPILHAMPHFREQYYDRGHAWRPG